MFTYIRTLTAPSAAIANTAAASTTRDTSGHAYFDSGTAHYFSLRKEPAPPARPFQDDKEKVSIMFGIVPDPSKCAHFKHQAWVATMRIKCQNVPRLMRDGFHWDVSNVIKEEGYIEWGKTSRNANDWDRAHKRWYFLEDTHHPRRWTASISVVATEPQILSNFSVRQLSKKSIRDAWAVNQNGRHIYGYRAYETADPSINAPEHPMYGFNAIYDEMPMQGFWPWPPIENEPEKNRDEAEEIKGENLGPSQTGTTQCEVNTDGILMEIEGGKGEDEWI
ncbi:hypothetical protein F5Y08DRAFT_350698 [Xylaria arbuscula]|nr:hypothetical protein F5Y08DRAFT_350698 [Xylaria arbuscula]